MFHDCVLGTVRWSKCVVVVVVVVVGFACYFYCDGFLNLRAFSKAFCMKQTLKTVENLLLNMNIIFILGTLLFCINVEWYFTP